MVDDLLWYVILLGGVWVWVHFVSTLLNCFSKFWNLHDTTTKTKYYCKRFHFANIVERELQFIFIKIGFVWDKVITVINWVNNVASINCACVCWCVRLAFLWVDPIYACGSLCVLSMCCVWFWFVLLNVFLYLFTTTNLDFVDIKPLSNSKCTEIYMIKRMARPSFIPIEMSIITILYYTCTQCDEKRKR